MNRTIHIKIPAFILGINFSGHSWNNSSHFPLTVKFGSGSQSPDSKVECYEKFSTRNIIVHTVRLKCTMKIANVQ